MSSLSGGEQPLGLITVAVPLTSAALNVNIGAQGQSSLRRATPVRQIIVSTSPKNTGSIYVIMGAATLNKTNSAAVVDEIPPGISRSYPQGALASGGAMSIDQWYLDADNAGDGAYCAVYVG